MSDTEIKGGATHRHKSIADNPVTSVLGANEVAVIDRELTADEEPTSTAQRLRRMRLAGYQIISVPGASPSFLMRHGASLPKVIPLRLPHCRALTAMHARGCDRGFASLDIDGKLEECTMPLDAWFGTGWVVRKQALGDPVEEVRHVAYHEQRGMYVVATCRLTDFMFVEEDGRHPEQDGESFRLICVFLAAVNVTASRAYTSSPSLFHGETSIVDAKSISYLVLQPSRLRCDYELDQAEYIDPPQVHVP